MFELIVIPVTKKTREMIDLRQVKWKEQVSFRRLTWVTPGARWRDVQVYTVKLWHVMDKTSDNDKNEMNLDQIRIHEMLSVKKKYFPAVSWSR